MDRLRQNQHLLFEPHNVRVSHWCSRYRAVASAAIGLLRLRLASERLISQYRSLNGAGDFLRWYQRLSWIKIILVPLRSLTHPQKNGLPYHGPQIKQRGRIHCLLWLWTRVCARTTYATNLFKPMLSENELHNCEHLRKKSHTAMMSATTINRLKMRSVRQQKKRSLNLTSSILYARRQSRSASSYHSKYTF